MSAEVRHLRAHFCLAALQKMCYYLFFAEPGRGGAEDTLAVAAEVAE